MGSIISTIKELISLGGSIAQDINNEKIKSKREDFNKIRNPIKPPFFLNRKDRDKIIKDGPYSSKGIIDSLNKDQIPAGYSLIQLSSLGFETEVDNFINRRDSKRNENIKNLKFQIDKIISSIQKDFPEISLSDREAIKKFGVLDKKDLDKIISEGKKLIIQAENNEISLDILNEFLRLLNLKISDIDNSLNLKDTEIQNREILEQEKLKQTENVLKIVRRGLKFKK